MFGAAGMGALCAVELGPFGMYGYGQVFSDLRAGRFEDDDEVTVSYGGAETEYRASSDAMVNIRATLRRACGLGIIAPGTQLGLEALAKSRFYADRHLLRLVREQHRGTLSPELIELHNWLREPTNWVDVKRRDALGLLRHVKSRAEQGQTQASEPTWSFPYTKLWEDFVRENTRST